MASVARSDLPLDPAAVKSRTYSNMVAGANDPGSDVVEAGALDAPRGVGYLGPATPGRSGLTESTCEETEPETTLADVMRAVQRIEAQLAILTNARLATAKVDADVRKLSRLEALETEATEDIEPNADFETAIEKKEMTQARVTSWFVEKGYGFAKIGEETVFIHASVVRVAQSLMVNERAVVRVMRDHSKPGNKIKATEAWSIQAWRGEQAVQRAMKAAERSKKAAELGAKFASESARATEEALFAPPGLMRRLSESREDSQAVPLTPVTQSTTASSMPVASQPTPRVPALVAPCP